jgi:conjugal transfer ATP-binding protein TraC
MSVDFEEIVSVKKRISATLGVAGVAARPLNASGLLQLLDGIWNTDFSSTKSSRRRYNPFDPLNDQVLADDTDIVVEDDLLKLRGGEVEVKCFSVNSYPPEWKLNRMGELTGDLFRDSRQFPYPFILHYGVHIPKQSGRMAQLSVKASMVEKQLNSPIGKYIPHIEREHAELEFVQDNLAKGERMVQTQFGVILFAPRNETAAAEQTLKTIFSSELFGIESQRGIQLHALLSIMPLARNGSGIKALTEFKRLRTTISTEAVNLAPIQAEWKGTETPGMILGGRRGQLMTFCPFDNLCGNYNVTVTGRSGSGKSVCMQELMASILGLGGRVFVMDVGRSFEKTCRMLEGQFIEFSRKKQLCLNPFATLDVANEEATEDALTVLKSVIRLMAAPINGVDDKGAALLEQATLEAFRERGCNTDITDIAERLLSMKDIMAEDLGKMLYPYTKKGSYGRYFNGPSNIDLDNPLVVIELEELKERKDLQAVVVQMMIVNITNKMFLGDRKTPFGIFFDEAWDMLRGSQSGVFIETLARRLRKYRGSLVTGTQSVNDFYSCDGARAAWENSDWNLFLSQKAESIAQLKKDGRFIGDAFKETLLTSVTTVQGKYAEVMISGTQGYAVGKLLLDPFSSLLFSTKPEDYAAVKDLIDRGYEIGNAVEEILKERSAS